MKKLRIIVLSVMIFFLGNTISTEAIELEGKIHKNVYIENIDISGLTKDEARLKMNKIVNDNDEMKLFYDTKVYSLKLSEINVNYNIEEMIDEAYNVGRSNGLISNIKTRIKLDMGETYIVNLKYSYDDKSIQQYLSYIQKNIDKEAISATIKIENEAIILEKETYGVKVDILKLEEIIRNKAKKLFYDDDNIPVIQVKPIHLYEELSKIDTILGTFETKFDKTKHGRVNNICVAAEATSNILVNRYEEFSFNNHTSDKNFISKLKKAPVIRNGKLEDGLGGGMCQVSTTIYNAALYSGLEITNIRNHSIPSSYIEKGRDATISSGNLDLKFKNNFNTPILIYNTMYEDKIVSTIYGNKEDKKDIDIVTEVVKVFPKETKYINSDQLYMGQKEIQKKGRSGYKVNTFRIYKNKNDLQKEFVFESYYPPSVEEVLQGTKVKIKEKEPKQNNSNNNQQNDKKENAPSQINKPDKSNNKDNLNAEII